MSTLTMVDRVNEYLTYRRALGYQLRVEGQMLQSFARYADESGHRGPVTTELALHWARLPEHAARLYQARRLEVVRTLARYLVPRSPERRSRPEVCSARLMRAARHFCTPRIISPRCSMRLGCSLRSAAYAPGPTPP